MRFLDWRWPLPVLAAMTMIVLAAPSCNALHVPNCRIGAHRYRYHCSPFHNLHQTSSALVLSRTSSTESIDTEDANAHIFLRFSPLIGGPSFLPLHVEVIITVEDTNNNNKEMKQNMNTIYIRRANNDISSTSFLKEQLALHRFDFLPEKPTDPVNLSRLVTLRSVPARVRHRSYGISNSNNMQTDDMNGVDTSTENQDGKGITILIPVGSIPSTYDGKDTTTHDIISTAINYKNEYKDSLFRELRLVGGKNCLQFALDLLAHIDKASTGIQRVTGLNKLDIK